MNKPLILHRDIRYQAAIRRGDHLLLLKVDDQASRTSFWLLPGGGREPGETEMECLQREVQEETSLSVEVGRLLLDEPADPRDETYHAPENLCLPDHRWRTAPGKRAGS